MATIQNMFKQLFPLLISLVIALGGGIYSADLITREFAGFDALQYGAWVAHPQNGTSDADPFARAHAARTGEIALGSAEGLTFIATQDDQGETILASCNYIIKGKTPAARIWTLRLTDNNMFPILNARDGVSGLHSGNTLRDSKGAFTISVSKVVTPGNWIPQSGNGERQFVLALYDTSVASTTGVSEIKMPAIEKIDCTDE